MSTDKCVYLLEEEPAHAMLLSYHIEKLGYAVKLFERATDFFFSSPENVRYVIASEDLSDIDSDSLCSKLMENYSDIKILFTTTRGKQCCTNCKDTLYIEKPFSLSALQKALEETLALTSIGK
ncbi:response regulator [Bacillus alkalicellulosilyticus]|uniref:response regulator n=1 Tax=Alkalihalobacterium alkalicellulosilyticum TaxID=1912214 RepID=UPI00099611E9|nr:response regulator [Bacillus alkalicellulosilyticus]